MQAPDADRDFRNPRVVERALDGLQEMWNLVSKLERRGELHPSIMRGFNRDMDVIESLAKAHLLPSTSQRSACRWASSVDGNHYAGPFDSCEEAIASLEDSGGEGWIARAVPAQELIDNSDLGARLEAALQNLLVNEIGEAGKRFTLTQEQQKALGQQVTELVERGPGFRCWGVSDARRIEAGVLTTLPRGLVEKP